MVKLKTPQEIEIMAEGGKKLSKIRDVLKKEIKVGVTPLYLDTLAEKLIKETGGESSFKKVKDYRWTTCININDGVVHGIPTKTPLLEGDLVKLDVGMFYKGFHTDTSFSIFLGKPDRETAKFLSAGEEALSAAIKKVQINGRIGEISKAMHDVLKRYGYEPVRALTGHGLGKSLHEEPQIPCFWEGETTKSEKIVTGMALAIEAIYVAGSPDLEVAQDNWTIATKDGKMAGLFEETVAVSNKGLLVLTA